MPITEKQRASREGFIGSSDIAAIMGLDRWRTAYDLYLEKKGLLEIPAAKTDTPWTQAGNYFEPAILQWFKDVRQPADTTIRANVPRVDKDRNVKCHIDAILYRNEAAFATVEIKTSGMFWVEAEEWGEFDTDQVPPRVLVQCYGHMHVTGTRRCYVPVFLGSRGLGMFVVTYRTPMMKMVLEAIDDFNRRLVEDDPPEVRATLDIIKYRKRNEGEVLEDLDAKPLVDELERSTEFAKRWKDKADQAKAAVIACLGDAEFLEFGDPKRCVSFSANKRGVRSLRVGNKPSGWKRMRAAKTSATPEVAPATAEVAADPDPAPNEVIVDDRHPEDTGTPGDFL